MSSDAVVIGALRVKLESHNFILLSKYRRFSPRRDGVAGQIKYK